MTLASDDAWSDVVGVAVISERRCIDDGDLALVSTLTWAISELHTNKERMRDSSYGERLFVGPALSGVVTGLHRACGGHDRLLRSHGVRLGRLQRMAVRFDAPVLVHDEIATETRVVAAGPATIELADEATNQRGEVVLRMTRTHALDPI